MKKRKGYSELEQPPNTLYFSKIQNPEEFPSDVKSYTIRPRWLMTFVLWVLRKLGFEVHDLRTTVP